MAVGGILSGLAVLAWILFLSPPVQAASSAWFDAEGGRIRLVAEEPSADGSLRAFLDIDLAPGWKTYWREPGESGIPPQLSLTDASGKSLRAALHFPPPERIDDGYSVWAGYKNPVRLPILLTQAPDGMVRGKIFLGICESICIPVETELSLDLSQGATALEQGMVEQAFQTLPGAPDDEFGIEHARLSTEGDRLLVTTRVPDGAEETVDLFAAAPAEWRLGTPKKIEEHSGGGLVTFALVIKDRPEGTRTDGLPMDVVLTTLSRSVRQSIPIP